MIEIESFATVHWAITSFLSYRPHRTRRRYITMVEKAVPTNFYDFSLVFALIWLRLWSMFQKLFIVTWFVRFLVGFCLLPSQIYHAKTKWTSLSSTYFNLILAKFSCIEQHTQKIGLWMQIYHPMNANSMHKIVKKSKYYWKIVHLIKWFHDFFSYARNTEMFLCHIKMEASPRKNMRQPKCHS